MPELISAIPAFLFTTFLLAVVPGQGVAMVLRQSIVGGPRSAFLSVLGNSAGLFIWGCLSAVGLSAIFAASETAYQLLKWSGVIFLVYLSLQTLTHLRNTFGTFDLDSKAETKSWPAFRLGLITNLTNVKAAVFAVAFLPQFVPTNFSLGLGIFIFGCIWPFVSASWYTFLIWTIKKSAKYIQIPLVRRALTAISAIGIMFLAVGLALSSGR